MVLADKGLKFINNVESYLFELDVYGFAENQIKFDFLIIKVTLFENKHRHLI